MKNSRNDQFNLNLCIRGLGNLVTIVHSSLYEYAYYLTFKRSMKMFAKEFNDAWEVEIEDIDFFLTTGDPFVINCYEARKNLMIYKYELAIALGIDEEKELANEKIRQESLRYKPYNLCFKHSKSYKRLKLYYERMLVETIKCLFTYACVLTAQSYKIPRVLTKQFDLPEPECYRLLNSDDSNVARLQELIVDLRKNLTDLRRTAAEQLLKTIANRRKKILN